MDQSFEQLLNEEQADLENIEGAIVIGTIIGVQGDEAIVDVGLKSEGFIETREFSDDELKRGHEIPVAVLSADDNEGRVRLSRSQAKREEVRDRLFHAYESGEHVIGRLDRRVKGGHHVMIEGVTAFMPQSHLDVRAGADARKLQNRDLELKVIDIDQERGNVVVSRKAAMAAETEAARSKVMDDIAEGDVIEGTVKRIKEYGAFVEIAPGVDGLLHISDIAYRRLERPSEMIDEGDKLTLKVLKVDHETKRIGLGKKQMEADPWDSVAAKYPVGGIFDGRVTRVEDYGAFVSLEDGVDGLVRPNEISWSKSDTDVRNALAETQLVKVAVTAVEESERKIELSIRQAQENPWKSFADKNEIGSILEGEVVGKTDFGMFVRLTPEIDGMVHISDLSYEKDGNEAIKDYKIGSKVNVRLLDVDVERERVEVGIKQLEDRHVPSNRASSKAERGEGALGLVLREAMNQDE